MDDNKEDATLDRRDYLNLVIEAGISSIPSIGGALQTIYFGSKNEKRFKRIENFYNSLNQRLSNIEDTIPNSVNINSQEQLASIIETIHEEIEKPNSDKKIDFFVNAYKNLILDASKEDMDLDEIYVNILSEITKVEIEFLTIFFKERTDGVIINSSYDQNLIDGSMNRLINFGLLNKHLMYLSVGTGSPEKNHYSISDFGANFCQYILS